MNEATKREREKQNDRKCPKLESQTEEESSKFKHQRKSYKAPHSCPPALKVRALIEIWRHVHEPVRLKLCVFNLREKIWGHKRDEKRAFQ